MFILFIRSKCYIANPKQLFDILLVKRQVKVSVALALESFAQLCSHKCLRQEESKQIQETYVVVVRGSF